MALLLSLETSTQACSVALYTTETILASRQIKTPRSAASKLAVMIQEVLEQANSQPSDLKGIIVASGPGSYTGLRIGVATAKGLCYALRIPLIAVNTLDLLAFQAKNYLLEKQSTKAIEFDEKILLCPMLDARRMEVYCKMLDFNLQEITPTQAKIIDKKSFDEMLDQKIIFFLGEGSMKCEEVIQHPNARFINDLVPDAIPLGQLGYKKWIQSSFEDVESFEPFYLKDFLIRKPNLV